MTQESGADLLTKDAKPPDLTDSSIRMVFAPFCVGPRSVPIVCQDTRNRVAGISDVVNFQRLAFSTAGKLALLQRLGDYFRDNCGRFGLHNCLNLIDDIVKGQLADFLAVA